MKKNFILFVAMMASVCLMQAQNSFTLNLGGAIPNGKYAESDIDENEWGLIYEKKDGGAGIGFNLGLQWNFGIQSVKGLSILFSVDAIVNTLNSDLNDHFDDVRDEMEDKADDYSLTTPKYINVPVMIGANYTYKLNEGFGVYGEAAMGLNLRKITNLSIFTETNGYEYSETYEYDFATSFGYRIGAGFVFYDKYTLGISYWNLGAAKVKGKATEVLEYDGDKDKDTDKFKLKDITPTQVLFRLGIRF